jgi:hypothetical protein
MENKMQLINLEHNPAYGFHYTCTHLLDVDQILFDCESFSFN